jgi:hypothetical protein
MNKYSTTDDPFLIAEIKLHIDIKSIITDCQQIVDAYKKQGGSTHDLTKPYSITLTHSPGLDEAKGNLVSYADIHNQKYFDRTNQAALQDMYAKTSLGKLVESLPFPFSIIRISVLPPNTIIGMHTDNAAHAQLALVTNQDCFVVARTGEAHHIPADGMLYVISTTLPHTAFNASDQERSHLSISIFAEDYVKLLQKSHE